MNLALRFNAGKGQSDLPHRVAMREIRLFLNRRYATRTDTTWPGR